VIGVNEIDGGEGRMVPALAEIETEDEFGI
jgi:hypothetical protein